MGFTELTNPHKASNLPGLVEVVLIADFILVWDKRLA